MIAASARNWEGNAAEEKARETFLRGPNQRSRKDLVIHFGPRNAGGEI
jgi:hypothetical protein